jgi:hypothetical protein
MSTDELVNVTKMDDGLDVPQNIIIIIIIITD